MTVSYRLAVYEPDGALRGYLTDHTSWDASFPFNDVGGLTVSVPQAYAALAAVPCEIAVEAAFESQPSAPFEETTSGRFVVEQSEVERTAGDAAIVKLTGRGYGALMDGAVVIPARYGSAANYDEDGKRRFLSATPGQILRTVLAEARSLVDGLRPGLTLAFTDTKDTLGVAWSKRMTISYEPGTSLLTVLDNMAAQGMVDWAMVGRSLFVWNPDSRAVESGRRIDIGLTEAPARASAAGLIHTAFLVGEKATWREDNTAGTPTPWGRSMTVLNQGGVTVEATARQLAGAALRAGSRIRYEYTCQWRVDEPGMPLPMVSFEPGDWVEARNAAGEWEAMRVHAVTVSDSGGVQKAALTLNDRFVDAEVRNAKRMKGIVNGASGDAGTGSAPKGPSDAKPQAPTGLVGQSWGYWADESGFETNTPRAAVQLDWAPVTLDVNNLPVALSGYEVDVAGKRATVDASGHEATLEDFACGHTVTCRVRAVSRGGRASDWASILVATDYPGLTLDPPTAADMSQSNGIVTIGWDGLLRPGLGAEDYEPPARFDHVRAEARTIVPGQQGTSAWEDAGTLSGPGVLVLDRSDLSDGATVTVRLYAVDRIGGESDPSVEASVELDFPIRREVHAAQDTADDAVAELRSDKAELDGKLAQARSDLAGLSTAQSALAGRVSDAETGLAAASARLSTAETNIAAAQASADDVAADLATEHAATATALAGIRTDLASASTRLATAETNIVAAKAAADDVAADLATEAASTATALAGIRSDLSDLDARQENLAGDLSTAEASLADARGRLTTAEATLSSSTQRLATAETAISQTTDSLTATRSELTTAAQDIRDLFTLVDGGQNWIRNSYDMNGWTATSDRISFSQDSSGCTIASWAATGVAARLDSMPRVPYKDLKGKTVTVSVWIHCGQTTPTYFRAGVMIGANDQAAYAATKSLNMVSQFRSGEWVRASATTTLTGSQFDTYGDDARIWFYVNTNASNTVPFDIKLAKVEIGETMTAWSPHPLDQSDSFAAIAQQLADAEQAIDRNRAELATLNATTLPAVNASVAQAAAAAAAADARAQTAQQAAAAAAARAFGQRNMVWNSRWDNSLAHWEANGTAAQSEVVTDAQGRNWLHCTSLGTSDAHGRIQRTWRAGGQAGKNKVQAEPGESYTLQALVYGTGTVRLGVGFAGQSGSGTTSSSMDIQCEATPRVVSYTRTCPANKAGFYVWLGATGGEAGEEVWITDVMLSKGTEPVDWTPAPEDADEALAGHDAALSAHQQAMAAAQAAIEANRQNVAAAQTALGQAQTRLSTAEASLEALKDRTDGLEDDLEASAGRIGAAESALAQAATDIAAAQSTANTARQETAAARDALSASIAAMGTDVQTALTGGVSIDRLFVDQGAVFRDAVIENLAANDLFASTVLAQTLAVEPSEYAPDPTLAPSAWTLNSRASIVDGVFVLSDDTTSYSQALGPWRSVKPGTKIAWSAQVRKSDEDVAGRFSIAMRRSNGTTTTDANVVDGRGIDFSTEWATYSGAYTVPAGTSDRLRVMLIRRTSQPATEGWYEVRNVTLRPQVGTVLIENGAVSAQQVDAASVAGAVGSFLQLNANQLTAGTIDTARLNAQQVAAAVGSFLQLNANQLTAGTIDTARLNAQDVAATVGSFLQLNANQISAGTISTDRLDAQDVAAAVGAFVELDANQIVSGTISTDLLSATALYAKIANLIEVDAGKVRAGQLSADVAYTGSLSAGQIVTGTLDTGRLNASDVAAAVGSFLELNASQLTAGTIDAGRIGAGTIDAGKLNATSVAASLATIIELDADRIVSGTIDTGRLNASEVAAAVGSFLTLNASQIVAGTIAADRIDVAGLLQTQAMRAITVDAANITGGTIDASHLNAQAVYAKIASLIEITADKIVSGTISTDRLNVPGIVAAADIRAKNVEASKVLATQGGFTQAVIESLVADQLFSDTVLARMIAVEPTEYAPEASLTARWWNATRAVIEDGLFVLPDAQTNFSRIWTPLQKVEPGTKLAWTLQVRKTSEDVRGGFGLSMNTDNGTANGLEHWELTRAASGYSTEWETISGVWEVPDGVDAVRVSLVKLGSSPGTSDGAYEVRGVSVRQQVGTLLIENGSITGDKIVVDSVLANDIIAAGTITASKIVADQAGFSQALVDQLAANRVFADTMLAQSLVIEPREYAPSPTVLPDWWDATRAAIEDGVFVLSDAKTTWGRVRGGWLKVRPGQRLAWSLEVRKTSASVAGAFAIGYRKPAPDREHEADGGFWLSEPASEFTTSWQARTGVFTVPDGVDELRVMVVKRGGAPGTSDGAYEVRNLSVRPQVGTVLIEDGAITGDKIVVDSVLANDIIAAGTITASKITVAPTDPADPDSGKLKAAQIDVAGVISVADLSAKTINASQIVGDNAALNAAFIRQLTGDQAFIDQILTQQISVAPSDYAPSPADRPDWWTLAGNATIETDTAVPGGRRFRLRETSPTAVEVKGRMRPINAKTEVYVSFWARCSSTMPAGTLTLQYTYRQPGGSTSTVVAYSVPKSGDDAISSTSWRKYEATITVPATASALSIGLRRTSIAASVISDATWYDVHGLTALAKTGSVLIANGAVTADKITVNAALVDKLTAGSLWAGKIATNMLSATVDQKNGLTGVTVSAAGVLARGSAGRVQLSSNGLEAYNAKTGGTRTFWLNASTGSVEMKGTLTSGSTITGATITGSLVRSGTGTTRVEMSGNDITFLQNSKRRVILTAADSSSHGGTGGWGHGGLYVYNKDGVYAGRVRGQIEGGTNKTIFAMDGPGSSSIWLQSGSGKVAWSNDMGLFAQSSYMWLKRNANQGLFWKSGEGSLTFGSNKGLYAGSNDLYLSAGSSRGVYWGPNGKAQVDFSSKAHVWVDGTSMTIAFGSTHIYFSSSDITLLVGNRGFRVNSNGTTEHVAYY